jgi:hypothetical protein
MPLQLVVVLRFFARLDFRARHLQLLQVQLALGLSPCGR